jgi:glucose/mannose transport system substrate-binding protein
MSITRRGLLAGSTALAAVSWDAQASATETPKVTVISQWSTGSYLHAMNMLGQMFTDAGGQWTATPVPGFTTDMMNKLRADIIAGNPPAVAQLKGPEIAEWSKIAPTVQLDDIVSKADYEDKLPEVLVRLHKPFGHWIALPLHAYRINTLYASKKAMDKVGATKLPATWTEFNELAAKMKAAGIVPVSHGGMPYYDAMYFEIVLAGISPSTYRRALMELDDGALRGPEMLAAFRQLRKMTTWMDPANAGQSWIVFTQNMMRGEHGMLLMGTWAQGVYTNGGFKPDVDYIVGPAPSDVPEPAFDLNADAFIFWKRPEPEYGLGQQLLANIVMGKPFETAFTQIIGSIPVRTDMDLSAPGFTDSQREQAAAFAAAVKNDRVVLSLGHNMAQPNRITAAMLDVFAEFVHTPDMAPEEGQKQLADAVDTVR